MKLEETCPDCSSIIPAGAPAGLCPECLLEAAVTSPAGVSSEAADLPTETPADPAAAHSAALDATGTIIDRYKLLRKIGEGGFGNVYLAEQSKPVQRRVALKVIKAGMDSKEVIARFEAERQALALMDHPNIAHVLDAGATEGGLPYFVMELVRGIPITQYCDEKQLDTAGRLELFIEVCSAVQHAHQKGIIHRDLKPSNILVSDHHGAPAIKVIDFGIAKAINMELTEKTVFTELGRMIGTPQYMSPEQAQLNAVDVDTRSDIYSLGVTLYELLTGRTPLDLETLRKAGYADVQRMIRDEAPVKPSKFVITLGAALPRIATARGTEPPKLQKTLRGDLDWIIMMALEKDRTRRYQTSNALAVDIRSFLDDELVSATPPSTVYRCAQFSKRHRVGVTWTAVICAIILAATIGMTVLYFRARKQTEVAETQKKIADQNLFDSLMSEADSKRKNFAEEGRRWKATDLIRRANKIFAELDLVDEQTSSENERRLRDTIISCLAIVDMRKDESHDGEWQTDPRHGGDRSLAAPHPALERYAHTLPDGKVAIYAYPQRGEPERVGDFMAGETGAFDGWRQLRFSPAGNVLAAAFSVGGERPATLKLWNVEDAGQASPLDAGECLEAAFDFSPDGKRCALARPDGQIVVIDCLNGDETPVHFQLSGAPHSISMCKDGERLAISLPDENKVTVIRISNGEIIAELEQDKPRGLAWSPAGDSLVICTETCMQVWRNRDWMPRDPGSPLELHGNGREDIVAWSPDGRLIASQNWRDGRTRLWDPFQGGRELCSHRSTGSSLQFVEAGGMLKLGLIRKADTLSMLEVATGNVRHTGRGHAGEIGIFDGKWNKKGVDTSGYDLRMVSATAASDLDDSGKSLVIVALVGGELRVRIFDHHGQMIVDRPESALVPGKPLETLKQICQSILAAGGAPVSEPDRQRIVALTTALSLLEGTLMATSGDDGVRIWNREARHLGHLDIPGARGLAFSTDALYVASKTGIWKLAMAEERSAGRVTVEFGGEEKIASFPHCQQISLSPDERHLAVTSEDGLWILDLETGRELALVEGDGGISSCAISADGLWLAANSTRGGAPFVSIWQMPEKGKPLETINLDPVQEIPVSGAARVAFSPLPRQQPGHGSKGDPGVEWLITGDAERYQFWKTGSWTDQGCPKIPSNMGKFQGKLALSSRGTALAIAVDEEEMQVFDLLTEETLSQPDFDREIPLCFDPTGTLMITARQSGGTGIFFWRLAVLRPRLDHEWGLDWEHLPDIPHLHFDEVEVRLPPTAPPSGP